MNHGEDTDDDSTSGRLSRKRPRPQYNDNDDTPMPVPVTKTQQLMIGDEFEVEKFYNVRFKDMQQSSCKIMGKAFVKLIEPKKQTHHPYTKGAAKAPPWWPPTVGENQVRHKEPDHLLKPGMPIIPHRRKPLTENRTYPASYSHSENDRGTCREAVLDCSEVGPECEKA